MWDPTFDVMDENNREKVLRELTMIDRQDLLSAVAVATLKAIIIILPTADSRQSAAATDQKSNKLHSIEKLENCRGKTSKIIV